MHCFELLLQNALRVSQEDREREYKRNAQVRRVGVWLQGRGLIWVCCVESISGGLAGAVSSRKKGAVASLC